MNKKNLSNFIITGVTFLLFIIFTILVATVDVSAVGPLDSEVGFSALNKAFHDTIGMRNSWYKLSEIMGIISILTIVGFGALGIYQWYKRKSIKLVDTRLLVLGIFYVVVAIFYVIFEIVVVNYRPVLIDGQLEASYPSSHTMLVVCVMSTAILEFNRILFNKIWRYSAISLASVIAVLTVVGRALSGMHWLTDVVGGLLLSAALVMLYISFADFIEEKKTVKVQE